MIDEIFGTLRGLANIGVVQSANDTGEVQTVTVITADGALRADVEVMQMYGFASLAPANGAICLLIAVGGDPANLRALPVATPAARFGGMAPGDTCVYAQDGSRIHIKQGGVIEIWAGASLTINAAEVTMTGTLNVVTDVVISGGSYIRHTHADAQGGETGPPTG
jgi:phage baseplate assembly protein V